MSEVLALGDVADVVAGVGFPKDMQGGQDGAIPVFKVGDISVAWLQGKSLLHESRNYLSAEEAKSLGKCVPAGATVFAKIGEALRLNRRVMLGRPALVDNNVMGLVPDQTKVSPKYLYYFMQTVDLGELSRSTTVPSIRKSDVVDIAIAVPQLSAQDEIVAELEKQFSRLGVAVANLQRVKANLKRYKASVLKAAVEGRLVETEATLARHEGRTYETGEQLLQRLLEVRRARPKGKSKYKEPAVPNLEAVTTLPEGWAWASVEQVVAHLTDGDHQAPPQTDSGVPFLVIGNVRTGEIDLTDTRFVGENYYNALDPYRQPVQGDLLYTLVGSYGIPARVRTAERFCIQRHMAILRPHAESPMDYLTIAMASDCVFKQATEVATGTAQMTVPLSGLRSIAIGLPPKAEQARIVAEVDRHLSVLREVEAEVNANLQRAQALRQSVLQRAFSTGSPNADDLQPPR